MFNLAFIDGFVLGAVTTMAGIGIGVILQKAYARHKTPRQTLNSIPE